MYLSRGERKEMMALYSLEDIKDVNHYQVGPDTWIYLFELNDTKYILISTDYFGDYEFEVFPHLLKYEDNRLEFVLQREILVNDDSLKEKTADTLLFEYTD
ncbi:MAG: hypothetical protein Q3996_00705 [Candidatus Saccharibacteria bacterium]|nr:hypothetical protein [Candidatus Saccharibacteria bacterium]